MNRRVWSYGLGAILTLVFSHALDARPESQSKTLTRLITAYGAQLEALAPPQRGTLRFLPLIYTPPGDLGQLKSVIETHLQDELERRGYHLANRDQRDWQISVVTYVSQKGESLVLNAEVFNASKNGERQGVIIVSEPLDAELKTLKAQMTQKEAYQIKSVKILQGKMLDFAFLKNALSSSDSPQTWLVVLLCDALEIYTYPAGQKIAYERIAKIYPPYPVTRDKIGFLTVGPSLKGDGFLITVFTSDAPQTFLWRWTGEKLIQEEGKQAAILGRTQNPDFFVIARHLTGRNLFTAPRILPSYDLTKAISFKSQTGMREDLAFFSLSARETPSFGRLWTLLTPEGTYLFNENNAKTLLPPYGFATIAAEMKEDGNIQILSTSLDDPETGDRLILYESPSLRSQDFQEVWRSKPFSGTIVSIKVEDLDQDGVFEAFIGEQEQHLSTIHLMAQISPSQTF